MKKIIPIKLIPIYMIFFLIALPLIFSLAYGIVNKLLYNEKLFFLYPYFLIACAIGMLILYFCNGFYGIYFNKDSFTYARFQIKYDYDSPRTIFYEDIKNIFLKNKGELYKDRVEVLNKKVVVVELDEYTYRLLDVSLYSNRQIKKILKILIKNSAS